MKYRVNLKSNKKNQVIKEGEIINPSNDDIQEITIDVDEIANKVQDKINNNTPKTDPKIGENKEEIGASEVGIDTLEAMKKDPQVNSDFVGYLIQYIVNLKNENDLLKATINKSI